MKLIMNADDFGYSRGVNYGIIDAYNRGIVRSTTMMANMFAFEQAIELADQHPGLGIGVHLTLTCGKALGGPYQTITDRDGSFHSLREMTEAKLAELDKAEIETEFELQIQRIIEAGIKPTHLDSHHHCHEFTGILPIVLKLALKYGLPIRSTSRTLFGDECEAVKTADKFIVDFYGDEISAEKLIELLARYKDEDISVEVMCHPSYVDQELMNTSRYNVMRTKELQVITSDEIAAYVASNEIELINFRNI